MERHFKTEKSFRTFFEKSEDDLLCFFIISSDLTGLPVDLFFDDSKSYEMWNHQLWIYFRNSYDKSSRNFLPMNVSKINPIVPIESYQLNITKTDLCAIQSFIKLHNVLIQKFANTEIDCEDVVNAITECTEGLRFSLKQAYYIIDNILRAHEKDGFNELIPSWHTALLDAMKTLKHAERTKTVEDYIERGEYLLRVMPPLELHRLEI